jgi:MFS family permease
MNSSPLQHTRFVALRYRDYRLLWLGQLISWTGSQMQTAAILWHVSELTGSPLALGGVGASRLIPILLFSLIGGVIADKVDRRRLMLLTQGSMTVLAAILGVTTLSGWDSVWLIYLISALLSTANAFDTPARQALIPSLVPKEYLSNAISLNSIVFQTASIAGPSLAGILLAVGNVTLIYFLNAVSFLTVIGALLCMNLPVQAGTARTEANFQAMLEGLRFVRSSPMIMSTMLLDFFATLFASAETLLPMFAKEVLYVGPQGYGWLYAATSMGSVTTGATLSLFGRIRKQGPLILTCVAIYGLATIGFGLSKNFLLSFICLFLAGVADTVSMVIRGTVRQLHTPDHLRGRMISVNMIFFMGGPQLGELEAGIIAQWFGLTFSVISGGVGAVLSVIGIMIFFPSLRHYDYEGAPVTQAK